MLTLVAAGRHQRRKADTFFHHFLTAAAKQTGKAVSHYCLDVTWLWFWKCSLRKKKLVNKYIKPHKHVKLLREASFVSKILGHVLLNLSIAEHTDTSTRNLVIPSINILTIRDPTDHLPEVIVIPYIQVLTPQEYRCFS